MARFERKYRVPDRDAAFLLEAWRPFLAPAPFTGADATYPVLSQYFDSPDLRFHREKNDGVGFRRKVRLRTYGMRFSADGVCFLEMKRRAHESVSKLRVRVPEFRSEHLDPSSWSRLDLPGIGPFCALHEAHRLRPSAQVLYRRAAYEATIEPGLRITFDSLVLGMHPGEAVRRGTIYEGGRTLIPETEVIVEVKGAADLPHWVRRGIQWCELQQRTVSKYVAAVESLNLVRLQGGVYA